MYSHVGRIRRFTFCQQRYTDSGVTYKIAWSALTMLNQHVSSARCRPGPFLPNLRVLHFDFYDRFPALLLADCFPHIGGRSLTEIHLHCDDDAGPEGMRLLDFTIVLPIMPAITPNLQHISVWDSRNYPANRPSTGISGLLEGLRTLHRFTCSLPLRNMDITSLARQPKLTSLSITLLMDSSEGPSLPPDVRAVPSFRSLDTLILQVAHIVLATAFVGLLDPGTLRKLRIATPMWFDETDLQACFKTISYHRRLQELSIAVVSSRMPTGHIPFGAQCSVKTSTVALLFSLEELLAFSLSAQDRARFETDLDDAGVHAMAKAWPDLRSISIVQGSWCPTGMTLAPTRITMKALLALRDHCPHLCGLSIGLDTSSFDLHVLQAAALGGATGHALRKLNIDARSTPVSNPSIAAQILHGLFPQLHTIHDGGSMDWDQKQTDWQEVASYLRGLNGGLVIEPSEYEFAESDGE